MSQQQLNQQQLERMQKGRGFIAALDQSGGSTPKALKIYGVTEDQYQNERQMFDLVHQMRSRIITSSAFTADHILAAILFDNTINRQIEGLPAADYLWQKKRIVPFLKVDKGLAELAEGVQMMEPLPNLEQSLQQAREHHIFGTKMRSVIKEANAAGIAKIVDQQFAVGLQIAAAGLAPILEPEVDIHSADKLASEIILKAELLKHLQTVAPDVKLLFKLSLPTVAGFYSELLDDPHVVRVVALSGGYSQAEANEKLAQNPGLIASFSRALSQGLNCAQSNAEFDALLAQSVTAIYAASLA